MIRQTSRYRDPAALREGSALGLLLAAALLLTPLVPNAMAAGTDSNATPRHVAKAAAARTGIQANAHHIAAAAKTDIQAHARDLAQARAILRRDRRLRRLYRRRRSLAHARRHRLAAIAQHGDAAVGGEACEGEGLTPEAGNLEEVRAATLCLVNRERLIHGEQALIANAKLERSAQGHTLSMVDEDYFSHYNPDGETPAQRMRASGYIYSSRIGYEIGENIAWGTLSLATPKAIVQAWMQSPGHRENILDRNYRETAIGVLPKVPSAFSEGEQGAIYTQDFGVIIAD